MSETFGIIISLLVGIVAIYVVIAIPYYYIKKIYIYFSDFKNTKNKVTNSKISITKRNKNSLDEYKIKIREEEKQNRLNKEKILNNEKFIYQKKYTDIGLKIPKLNNKRSSVSLTYKWVNPIVPRILEYNKNEIISDKIEKTKVGHFIKEFIKQLKDPIEEIKVSGLNGYAKNEYSLKREGEKKEPKLFNKNYGYNKIIAKAYTLQFRPINWVFHKKLKSYDDYFNEIIEKGEQPPPWDDFVKKVFDPINDQLFKKFEPIINKYSYKKLSKLKLSPPRGQKIKITLFLLTSSKDLVYYNQQYLSDFGKKYINKIAYELDLIFKRSNLSLHHCYEDSIFREQSLRLAENNFRKKNNVSLIGEGWTSQTELFNQLKKYFVDIEKEYSPKWLKPKRIDIFIKKPRVSIEYHGYQHYFPISFFGGEKAFKKRQIDDKQKEKKCLENNSSFIEWPYDLEINNRNINKIKNFINSNKNRSYSINAKNIVK